MKKLLLALLVGTLLAGCGGEEEKEKVEEDAKEEVVDNRAEGEANPEPYGGPEVLAKIKLAKESGATELDLDSNQISDLTSLAELTNLKTLYLYGNQITDLTPLAGLTGLTELDISCNQITDLSPLKGLTNLRLLSFFGTQITHDQKVMVIEALPDCVFSF